MGVSYNGSIYRMSVKHGRTPAAGTWEDSHPLPGLVLRVSCIDPQVCRSIMFSFQRPTAFGSPVWKGLRVGVGVYVLSSVIMTLQLCFIASLFAVFL